MKKLFLLMALSVGVGSLSSCNTYIGMGRDIQKLGEGIQNTGYGTGWSGNKPSPYPQPAKPAEKKP
ncbi:entericidin A/B family lipoprotein [Verrucomicrobiaceae bacterium N1E253]|uniref:Entericidin A/B family lipoprotein n=1 Tax=Oceaniferula marina TaxID=2748318 RepID=A0A851GI62_9BACT|nr:entericidin A/B family lipoprotein [Oceaniferula marina]NWK57478.1 entericidin A/B family lipoprotein [Oceaniferula marina]